MAQLPRLAIMINTTEDHPEDDVTIIDIGTIPAPMFEVRTFWRNGKDGGLLFISINADKNTGFITSLQEADDIMKVLGKLELTTVGNFAKDIKKLQGKQVVEVGDSYKAIENVKKQFKYVLTLNANRYPAISVLLNEEDRPKAIQEIIDLLVDTDIENVPIIRAWAKLDEQTMEVTELNVEPVLDLTTLD